VVLLQTPTHAAAAAEAAAGGSNRVVGGFTRQLTAASLQWR
jgi:hypothetical protein